MSRFLYAWILVAAMISCGPEVSENEALRQPPYAGLTDSIRQNPDNADLYYRRGVLLYQTDQAALAQSDLQKAWTLQPREEFALSLTTVLREKSNDSAVAFLQKAVRALPGSIALQVGLARGYQQQGRGKEAMALTETLLARHPGLLDALLLQAELLRAAGREAESLLMLERAYRLAPSDPELAHNLAFAYAEAENPKALALADSLIGADVRQQHAEPYYFRGVYYANTGQPAKAIAAFDEAIRKDYNFMDAHMDKGRVLFEQKQYRPALQAFQLALRITPSFADAYYWTGRCEEALGDKENAKLNYQRAYSLDKTLTEAKAAADRL